MSTTLLTPQMQSEMTGAVIQANIEGRIEELMAALPTGEQLGPEGRRGLIARYSSVLEGNFIYWMTSGLLAIEAKDAHEIILENLNEEIRDAHPAMLRRFAVAAHAFPEASDAMAVNDELTAVRLFIGKLCGVQTLATLAMFEGFIQKFMAYLADLAVAQGSTDLEYTDVHGVCDIAHTEGLFRALGIELASNPLPEGADVYEGVELLDKLIVKIVHG